MKRRDNEGDGSLEDQNEEVKQLRLQKILRKACGLRRPRINIQSSCYSFSMRKTIRVNDHVLKYQKKVNMKQIEKPQKETKR